MAPPGMTTTRQFQLTALRRRAIRIPWFVMSVNRPLRVLLVGQGCGGGIGRVELLIERALASLEGGGNVQWKAVRKGTYPDYFGTARGNEDGRRISLAKRAIRTMSSFHHEVVVFTHVNLCPLSIPMRLLRPSTAFVTIVHGKEAWKRLSWIRRFALVSSKQIWSVSKYTAVQLEQTNAVPASRIRLLRLGIPDTQRAALNSNKKRKGGGSSHVIVTVSRLEDVGTKKGIDHLIEALAEVSRSIPKTRLVIVGDGPGRPMLERLAARCGVGPHVEFTGPLTDDQLARVYHGSDIFVLPSAQEGFGIAYLEAMASGLPIVAAKAAAVPEVVVDGKTGLLVDYGDVSGLAQAIGALLQDPKLRRWMGHHGLEVVRSTFTMDQVKNVLALLLSEVSPVASALLRSG
jgi:phosphatidylinositol alpha-1,6-mannosyltransferase